MTLHQLSIFLENQPGYLNRALQVLAKEQININALTIADTADYGIVRLIVSEPKKALEALKAAHFSVRSQEILSVEMRPEPGALASILALFEQAELSLEYVYAFSFGSKSILVLRTNNREKALEVIRANHLQLVQQEDLK